MIAPAGMSNDQLATLIRGVASKIHEDQLGFWKFELNSSLVFVITDESHNRMRIMSPIVELADLPQDALQTLLEANFDRALDARYCINSDTVWSAFLHPLAELDDRQFLAALDQVVTLKNNFGTTFTSSDLIFGGGG